MTYRGSIKSFNPLKGFGFIECKETFEMYGKDMFVLKTALPGKSATAGDQVTFEVTTEHNGPVATNVQVARARSGGKGRSNTSASRTLALPSPAGKAGTSQGSSIDPTYETSFVGTVKSFNHQKGWGMIECDLTMKLYGKDVFVSSKHLEGTVVSQNDQVRFVVRMEDKGPAAFCVQLIRPSAQVYYGGAKGGYSMPQMAAPVQQWSSPPVQQWGATPGQQWSSAPVQQWDHSPPNKIFFGVLKAWNEEKGWGHIACDATKALYNKDVFLLSGKLGGATPEIGALVSFKVQLGSKGPQAEQFSVLPAGSWGSEDQPGSQHSGTIKSFSPEKGWGFIEGEQLRQTFGKDIFVNKRELGGYSPDVGDKVSFTVALAEKDGQPQAKNVVRDEGYNGYEPMAPLRGGRPTPY